MKKKHFIIFDAIANNGIGTRSNCTIKQHHVHY